MKYMLLMSSPGATDYQLNQWRPEEIAAHVRYMHDLNEALTESGEFVDGQGLAAPDQVRVVTAGPQGEPVVTDGPFPESKEFLAGYWIVDCDSVERVYEIAATASAAPGPGGVPLPIPIEVRQVLGPPPFEDL
jgi:hypothetical protein